MSTMSPVAVKTKRLMSRILDAYTGAPDALAANKATDNAICSREFDELPTQSRVAVMNYLAGAEDAAFKIRGWRGEDRQFSVSDAV